MKDEKYIITQKQTNWSYVMGAIVGLLLYLLLSGCSGKEELKNIIPENHPDIEYSLEHEKAYPNRIKTHWVQQDETLYSISRKYKVSVKGLKKLNGDSEVLEVNQIVRIE